MSDRGRELERAVQQVLHANTTLRRELAEAREENRRLRMLTSGRAQPPADPEQRRRRALLEPWARNP